MTSSSRLLVTHLSLQSPKSVAPPINDDFRRSDFSVSERDLNAKHAGCKYSSGRVDPASQSVGSSMQRALSWLSSSGIVELVLQEDQLMLSLP